MQHFLSDNASPVHPKVLEALSSINTNYEPAYGLDTITEKAKSLFRDTFGQNIEVCFVSTGTAANVIALKSVLEPFEAVICANKAHLNRDECAAPEALIGCKLLTIEATNGKITPKLIEPLLIDNDMVHRAQPRVVSISQCTEWGTVYQLEELEALADFCHDQNLLLHVDGARLANAACHLNTSLHELCLNGKVDLLSFGGTKNGLIGAEAIVFFKKELANKAPFVQKQFMHLSSKMRYISAQFIALLTDDLWQRNAKHANQMSTLLETLVKDQVEIVMPVESNVIFAKLPEESIQKLQAAFPFAVWNSKESIVRWMTSYDTKEETVRAFASKISEVLND